MDFWEWIKDNQHWIIPSIFNLLLGIVNIILVVRNTINAKKIRQKERYDDINREEFNKRNENVYKPLWEQVNNTKIILLNDLNYYLFMLEHDLSSFGAPFIDVIYMTDYLSSANSILEKTSLNEDIEVLLEKIKRYNSTCNYAAQEIKFIYSNILSKYAIEFKRKYKCENIEVSYYSTLADLFVLFGALNNKDFYVNYIDSSDTQIDKELKFKFLSYLSIKSYIIKSEVNDKMKKDFDLLNLFFDVKNKFMSIEEMLRFTIKGVINRK